MGLSYTTATGAVRTYDPNTKTWSTTGGSPSSQQNSGSQGGNGGNNNGLSYTTKDGQTRTYNTETKTWENYDPGTNPYANKKASAIYDDNGKPTGKWNPGYDNGGNYIDENGKIWFKSELGPDGLPPKDYVAPTYKTGPSASEGASVIIPALSKDNLGKAAQELPLEINNDPLNGWIMPSEGRKPSEITADIEKTKEEMPGWFESLWKAMQAGVLSANGRASDAAELIDSGFGARRAAKEQVKKLEEERKWQQDKWRLTPEEKAEKQARVEELTPIVTQGVFNLDSMTAEEKAQWQKDYDELTRLQTELNEAPLSFDERFTEMLKSAGLGLAANYTDMERALYQGGQEHRTAETEAKIAELEAEIEKQKKQQEEEVKYWTEDYNKRYVINGVDTGPGLDNYLSFIYEDDTIWMLENQLEAYRQVVRAQEGATAETAGIADHFQQMADDAKKKATKDVGGTEAFLVDAGINGVQMLSDAVVNLALGTPQSLLPLFARSFGGGTQTARQAGADINQQLIFGAATASVEALTEKMFDGLAGLYGKGMADDMTELILKKIAAESSPEVRAALTLFLSGAGEAAEEGVSSRLEPWLKAVYDKGDSIKETYGSLEGYKQSWADTSYEMLVGFVMGEVGGTISTGKQLNEVSNGGTNILNEDFKTAPESTTETSAAPAATEETAPAAPAETPAETPAEPVSPTSPVADALAGTEEAAPAATHEQNQTTVQNPAADALVDILNRRNADTGTVTNSAADAILSDTTLKTAFEEAAGAEIKGSKSDQRTFIKENADAVIAALTGTQQNIDNAPSAQYNNGNETIENTGVGNNGPEAEGPAAALAGVGGEAGAGVSGVGATDTVGSSEGSNGETASGVVGERTVTLKDAIQKLSERLKSIGRGIVNVGLNNSTDSASYSSALDAAKAADPEHGQFVSAKTAAEIQAILDAGGVVLMSEDGSCGLVVTKDGDIEAAFRNQQTGKKGSLPEMLISAIANGGTKLDCYGIDLANSYAKAGFVPVARVIFDPEIAMKYDGWTQEQIDAYKAKWGGHAPDVIVMMHNGTTAQETAQNYANVDWISWEELDALPTFSGENGYDDAIAYRDSLLEQQESTSPDVKNQSEQQKITSEPVENQNEEITKPDVKTEPAPEESTQEDVKNENEQEKSTQADVISEEQAREYTPAQLKVAELLGFGDQITDEEVDKILNSKALLNAIKSFGFIHELGTLDEQRQAVRAFAQDIVQNGLPTEEAVAKINQDIEIESQGQEDLYTIEQLREELKAAIIAGDNARRAAVQQKINELNAKKNRRNLLNKIKETAKTLTQGINNQNGKNYVPAELIEATADFLEEVNNAMVDPNSTSKATARLAEKFAKISRRFQAMKDTVGELGIEGEQYSEEADVLMQAAKNVLESGTPLNQMSIPDLDTISKALQAMDHALKGERSVEIKGQKKAAFKWMQQAEQQVIDNGRKGDNAGTKAINLLSRPLTFFKGLAGRVKNSATEALYHLLNNGAKKTDHIKLESYKFFTDLIAETKNYRSLRNEVELKGLKDADGNTVKISRGMMLSLYLHLLNEQNSNHIAGGGITVAQLADYYKNRNNKGFGVGQGHVVGMSQEMNTLTHQLNTAEAKLSALEADGQNTDAVQAEIEAIKTKMDELKASEAERMAGLLTDIEGKLTNYEQRFIAAAQEFFLWAQKNINTTSHEELGFINALVENYFPINSDPNFRKGGANTELEGFAAAKDVMESLGITQQRTNANGPIRLFDITDVLNSYINQMSQYCGVLPALRQFNMIMDSSYAGHKGSLRNTIADMYGQDALNYIHQLTNNLQGKGKSGGWIENMLNTTRGNFASSVLTLNARVAGSQAVSIFNAAPVLGWDNLAKSVGKKAPSPDFIAKYSDTLAKRTSGKNTHKFEDLRTDFQSVRDRITRKFWFALNWINDVDNWAVRRLWPAAELYVQQHNPDLEVGSEEYYKEVARKFDEATERTQPSYNVMQKSALQRTDSDLVRSVSMFITQRMQNLNEVYDDIATAVKYNQDFKNGINDVTKEDVQEANRTAANAVSGLVISSLALNVLKGVVDAALHRTRNYRDKETGELTLKSAWLRIMDYTAETIISTVPGGEGAYQLGKVLLNGGKYYGTSVPGVDTISGMVEDIVSVARASEKNRGKALLKAAESVATVFSGMPLSNAKQYVEAAIHWVEDFQDKTFLESDYTYTTAQNKNQVYDALLGGDTDKLDRAMDRMGDNAKENATDVIKVHFYDGDIDYTTSKDMLQSVGYTSEEADAKILEWHTNTVYETGREKWEKERENRTKDTDLDKALDRTREDDLFKAMSPDEQNRALNFVYGWYRYLENKDYAEDIGMEFENQTYESYEDLPDPVGSMLYDKRWNEVTRDGKEDFDAIDAMIAGIPGLSDAERERVEQKDHVKKLEAAADLDNPIGSEDFFDILDFYNQLAKWNTEAKNGPEQRDEAMIDATLALIAPLLESEDARAIFNDNFAWGDELLDAREIGMGSELFFKYFDQYNKMNDPDYIVTDPSSPVYGEHPSADWRYNEMYRIVENADDLTREQKELLHSRFKQTRFITVADTVYEKMVDRGMDADYAWGLTEKWADAKDKKNANLQPGEEPEDLTATEKARVIWDDTTLSVPERLTVMDQSGLIPTQKDFAVWLLAQVNAGTITMYEANDIWKKVGDKKKPKPWSTGIIEASKKK